jgi:GNAT superfamily N-acetyltransferase
MFDDVVTIRRAADADAAVFPSIENSAGTLFVEIADLAWLASADDLPVARYREIVARAFSWCAIDRTGRCVGFVCGEREDDILHIWEMAVPRDRQRRGIGRALLETLIETARSHGLSAITLTTFRDVPWNAAFYRRFGFAILSPDETGDRLRSVLVEENMRRLPIGLRCAMRLDIASSAAKP